MATDKDVYPNGEASGFFGSLTEKAIRMFQLKYGVIKSEKSAGAGRLGPATRAKIAEIFKDAGTEIAAPATTTQTPSTSGSPAAVPSVQFSRPLKLGSSGTDVAALQNFLEAKGLLKVPAGVAKGYFGPATRHAAMKYQESIGLEAVGSVGPGTRAKLNSLVKDSAADSTSAKQEASSESSVAIDEAKLKATVEAAMKEVERLQAELLKISR